MKTILTLLLCCMATTQPALGEYQPDWTGQSFDPLKPLEPDWADNPVLGPTNLPMRFCADPFLFFNENVWWLFFESYPMNYSRGNISVARSLDGVHWHYDSLLLDTAEQLSYPLVFRWGEDFYLAPDRYPTPGLLIYRCDEAGFPHAWKPIVEILMDRVIADATLFRHDGRWWIFASNSSSSTLWLWYSDSLLDPKAWTEHPQSPLYTNDRSRCRPAGRILKLDDGRMIRLAQRNDQVYGQAVRAFEIQELSTTAFAEIELPESPILSPSGSGWNGEKMHHLDAWWTGRRWLCAVDGNDGEAWSIGIYSDSNDPTGVVAMQASGGLRLAVHGMRQPRIRYYLPDGGIGSLTLHDIKGRRLRVFERGYMKDGWGSLTWDGSDSLGRKAASGLYLVRLEIAGETAAAKFILLP